MKKKLNIDDLLRDSGWVGVVARVTNSICFFTLAKYLPDIYKWVSSVIFSSDRVISEDYHAGQMMKFYILLGIHFLFEAFHVCKMLFFDEE